MAKQPTATFRLTPRWQYLTLVAVIIGWLNGFLFLSIAWPDGYLSAGTIVFQLSMAVQPLLWFGLSLWWAWGRYKRLLPRLCAAGVLSAVAYQAYAALASTEEVLRNKFYPQVIASGDNSWWTAYGHEWLVAGIGLALFGGGLALLKFRRKV